jgi:hypothetical protein
MRQISGDDEAKKEKYFNETIVDLDVLNRTTSKMSARQLTQKSDADDDEADELLNLLQDLGDEREILLDQTNEEDPEPGPSIVRRQDEQDEIDTLEMTQICWDVDPFDEDEKPKSEKKSESESDELWDGEKTFWENINLDDLC